MFWDCESIEISTYIISSQSNSPGQRRCPVWSLSRPLSSLEFVFRAGTEGPNDSLTHVTTADLRLPASSPWAISEPLRNCNSHWNKYIYTHAKHEGVHCDISSQVHQYHLAQWESWQLACAWLTHCTNGPCAHPWTEFNNISLIRREFLTRHWAQSLPLKRLGQFAYRSHRQVLLQSGTCQRCDANCSQNILDGPMH